MSQDRRQQEIEQQGGNRQAGGRGEEPLLDLAGRIADGTPVDWEEARTATPDEHPRLGNLRLVESLARAHRDSASPESAPGADAAGGESLEDTCSPRPAGSPPWPGVTQPTWGRLQLIERLGGGNFGEVYRAWDSTLRREVALKLLRADGAALGVPPELFLEEGRRLARVRHPHVLIVHGADVNEGRVGIWTELIDGKTLEKCLEDQGPFGAREAALIGIDLCGALAALHAEQLIHRDVKTLNVMREKGGRIVLMDFGSVFEAEGTFFPHGRMARGTPLAMPPEVLLRAEPATPATDVYGLGVLLYRITSGRYPVEARTLEDLVVRHRDGQPVHLRSVRPGLPSGFIAVIERALEPDPALRYRDTAEMERGLLGFIASAESAPERSAPAQPRPRRGVWWAAAALLLAGALLAFALANLPGRAAPLQVAASLYRASHGAQERLDAGGRIYLGDDLFVEIEGSEPFHAYVLDEDARGEAYVLFPAGLDLANPLGPDTLHTLPGRRDGVQQFWRVTSDGGAETVLVIASRSPLPQVESEIALLPRAREGHTIGQLRPAPGAPVRGIGGIVPEPPGGSRAGTLRRVEQILTVGGRSEGVRLFRFTLNESAPR